MRIGPTSSTVVLVRLKLEIFIVTPSSNLEIIENTIIYAGYHIMLYTFDSVEFGSLYPFGGHDISAMF